MAEHLKTDNIEMTDKVKGIVEAISSLNVMELIQLVRALEKVFGISGIPVAAAPVGQVAVSTSAPAEKQEEQKPKAYNVVLKDAGPNKLQIIKEIRAILPNLNIKEAKDFVESLPKVVKEGVSEAEAKELKERLEKVGAKVELTS